jgi:hypothetical protein
MDHLSVYSERGNRRRAVGNIGAGSRRRTLVAAPAHRDDYR